jgi:hypothetical protein
LHDFSRVSSLGATFHIMAKFFRRKAEFTEIPQSEAEADMEALIPKQQSPPKPSWTSRLWSPLCLLVGLTVGAYLGTCYAGRTVDLDDQCIKHIALPCMSHSCHSYQANRVAPVIQEVEIEFETVSFNGSLFKKNAYRQDAGPEVDAAWEALGVDCMPRFFAWNMS